MKNKHSGLFTGLSKLSKYAKLLKIVKTCYYSYLNVQYVCLCESFPKSKK